MTADYDNAHTGLEDAIRDFVAAYFPESNQFMSTAVLVVASHDIEEQITATGVHSFPEQTPDYVQIGLLAQAEAKLNLKLLATDDD